MPRGGDTSGLDVATQCRYLHLQSCMHSSTSFEGHWIEPSFLQVSVLPEPPPLTDPPGYTTRERSVTPSCMPHYVDGNVTRDHPYTVAYGEAVKLPLYPMGGPTSRRKILFLATTEQSKQAGPVSTRRVGVGHHQRGHRLLSPDRWWLVFIVNNTQLRHTLPPRGRWLSEPLGR